MNPLRPLVEAGEIKPGDYITRENGKLWWEGPLWDNNERPNLTNCPDGKLPSVEGKRSFDISGNQLGKLFNSEEKSKAVAEMNAKSVISIEFDINLGTFECEKMSLRGKGGMEDRLNQYPDTINDVMKSAGGKAVFIVYQVYSSNKIKIRSSKKIQLTANLSKFLGIDSVKDGQEYINTLKDKKTYAFAVRAARVKKDSGDFKLLRKSPHGQPVLWDEGSESEIEYSMPMKGSYGPAHIVWRNP